MKNRRIIINVQTRDDTTIDELLSFMSRLLSTSKISASVTAIEVREISK